MKIEIFDNDQSFIELETMFVAYRHSTDDMFILVDSFVDGINKNKYLVHPETSQVFVQVEHLLDRNLIEMTGDLSNILNKAKDKSIEYLTL